METLLTLIVVLLIFWLCWVLIDLIPLPSNAPLLKTILKIVAVLMLLLYLVNKFL